MKQRTRRRTLARRYSDVKDQNWYERLMAWRKCRIVQMEMARQSEKLRYTMKLVRELVPIFQNGFAVGGVISGEAKYLVGAGLGSAFALATAVAVFVDHPKRDDKSSPRSDA